MLAWGQSGLKLSTRDIFKLRTLSAIAAAAKPLTSGADAIKRVPRDVELPLGFRQQRYVDPKQKLARPGAKQLRAINAAFAFELDLTDVLALERALLEIVRRHEVLRTSYREHGERIVQVVQPFV